MVSCFIEMKCRYRRKDGKDLKQSIFFFFFFFGGGGGGGGRGRWDVVVEGVIILAEMDY